MNSPKKLLTKIYHDRANYGQPFQSHNFTTAKSVAKQPSKLGILILLMITLALSAFSISELNQTVTGIIEAEFQETIN